uniref:S100/CaBP-9k-type calcium binding subdomain domain-containing protein n=1 Tax=Zonotrichia albicollis TaxID=44394 RepID=A0A8D2MP28_ZONAL
MPSQLEHAMETLMFTFHKYAGDKEHLAKEDLRALMDKEFPGFLEVGMALGGPGCPWAMGWDPWDGIYGIHGMGWDLCEPWGEIHGMGSMRWDQWEGMGSM